MVLRGVGRCGVASACCSDAGVFGEVTPEIIGVLKDDPATLAASECLEVSPPRALLSPSLLLPLECGVCCTVTGGGPLSPPAASLSPVKSPSSPSKSRAGE